MNALHQMDISSFKGILEADETYFLYPEKGKRGITYRKPRKRGGVSKFRGISREQVCVLVARDCEKNTVSKIFCQGRINIKQVDKLIGSRVSVSNILCSDAWRSYSMFARQKGLDHYSIKSTEAHVKNIYHIPNVNNYHKRLEEICFLRPVFIRCEKLIGRCVCQNSGLLKRFLAIILGIINTRV